MKRCLAQSWSRRVTVFVSLVFLLLIPLSFAGSNLAPAS